MIEHLFGSKTRVKLLHVFYTNPNRSFYVREVTRKVDEQINSVRRELSNLLSIGVIRSDASGNKVYYEVNQEHPFYQSLHTIFTNLNADQEPTISSEIDSASRFAAIGNVDYAILSGIFTLDATAPVDVLIVGNVNRTKLENLIAELEAEEGRELRYTVLSREQYDYRRDLNDRFLSSVMDSKHTVVVDRINVKVSTDRDGQQNTSDSPTKKKGGNSPGKKGAAAGKTGE
ncbi:transcriptional regulator [Candidatus Saccharibacteria bacterium QS_5_54_17]|nr:MAG: transcriptional regulator [Candidatus Saccharibacteria bacterium QS_5_54_17]